MKSNQPLAILFIILSGIRNAGRLMPGHLPFALAFLFSICGNKIADKKDSLDGENGFAVVELFTSEGCSSCPAADDVIIKLAKQFPEHVYFLGFHVDYWDYIGWKDAFSNADYTKRQNKYVDVLKIESPYTPQVIVNGKLEMVGSREQALKAAITEQLKSHVSSNIQLKVNKPEGQTLAISYSLRDKNVLLNIALVQLMASTDVKRGENLGRHLNHINIVRQFKTINIVDKLNGASEIRIPAGLTAKDVKLIAFVQDRSTMEIKAAVEASVQ